MRVVVTGAAGFIGYHLATACNRQGLDVVGIDCLHDDLPARRANAARLLELGVRMHQRDLGLDPVDDLVEGAEVIFHLAARPGVRTSWREAFASYSHDNVLATQRLLEAACAAGVPRVVYASSSSVYGEAPSYPTTEQTPTRPVSPYGVTKLAGEHLCLAYAASHPVDVVILRYFTVYGPGQRSDMAIRRLIGAALDGTEFSQHGDGKQVRDFTYVDDVVRANLLAAGAGIGGPLVLNIGGGSSVSLAALVAMIERLCGTTIPVRALPAQRGDVRRTVADTSAAARSLGWRPATPLDGGLRAQLEWQRALAAVPARP